MLFSTFVEKQGVLQVLQTLQHLGSVLKVVLVKSAE